MTLSITIDLDPLRCYRQLYGLPPEDQRLDPAVLTGAARFAELLAELGCVGTLFVVGDSVQTPEAQARFAALHKQGHELANHTWSHPYDLSRRSPARIDNEISRGAKALTQITGQAPAGFRAPGYLLGDEVLPSLKRVGAIYDSSVLPSPLYQAAKATVIGTLKLMGRPSDSIVGRPAEAFGPSTPYFPDHARPWRKSQAGLVELPITTALGLPLTGGVLALLGKSGAAMMARTLSSRSFINLELHGVDLLDIESDGLDSSLGAQADLRIPWRKKASIFRAFIQRLMTRHPVRTLEQVALG